MNNYIQKGTLQYWRAISALLLGSLASFGAIYCTQPLIPIFAQKFGLGPSTASLVVSLTTGGMAVTMVAIAGLAGFLNRKLTMAVSLLGAATLTIAVALSNDYTAILVCRAVQGILVAGFPAVAMAYINEEFEPATRGLATGIYISGTSLGGLFGRISVSTLTDMFSWQIALIGTAIISVIAGFWFCFSLPPSRNFSPQRPQLRQMVHGLEQNLRSPVLIRLYLVAFAVMGSFTAIYNYISYPLLAAPYNLSHTAVGSLFLLYLIGTFSSTFMGGMADQYGQAKVACFSILLMLVGGITTANHILVVKIMGLAVFTFGFFGTHSTVSSWVSKCCPGDKAQASSLYLLFYYCGSSVIGTAAGLALSYYGWAGVVGFTGIILGLALANTGMLVFDEETAPTEWEYK